MAQQHKASSSNRGSSDEHEVIDLTSDTEIEGISESESLQTPRPRQKHPRRTTASAKASGQFSTATGGVETRVSTSEVEVIDLTSDTEFDEISESKPLQKHRGKQIIAGGQACQIQHLPCLPVADDATDRVKWHKWRSTSISTSRWFPGPASPLRKNGNQSKIMPMCGDYCEQTAFMQCEYSSDMSDCFRDQRSENNLPKSPCSRSLHFQINTNHLTTRTTRPTTTEPMPQCNHSGHDGGIKIKKDSIRSTVHMTDPIGLTPKDKKSHLNNLVWRSDDDDDDDFELDKKLSPRKPVLSTPKPAVHYCYQSSPGRATALSPMAKSITTSSCPISPYKKTQLASFHRICGSNSNASSGSESDLPNPRPFLLSHQKIRTNSPILVDPYRTIRTGACKRELLADGFQSGACTPKKKTKFFSEETLFSRNKSTCLTKNSPIRISSPIQKKSLMARRPRPLLTHSDFSSSDDDFESSRPSTNPVRTPRKTKKRPVAASPCGSPTSGSSTPCKGKDRSCGAPIHVSPRAIRGPKFEKQRILKFCQRQRDMIEAVADEDFFDDAISFIRDFANLHRGAPKEYMTYLLNDVLLADGMSEETVMNAYEALLHIHHLHPTSATNLTIDWDLVTAIIRKLNLETKSRTNDSSPHLADILALQFIVIVIADNFQAMRKKNLLRKSYSYSLLSADLHQANLRHLIQWICSVITNKLNTENSNNSKPEPRNQTQDRNIWDAIKQFTQQSPEPKANKLPRSSPPTPTSEGYFRVLLLLQKLLLLGFTVNKGNGALKIAEELLYPYLNIPHLEQRKLCLQTMACDPVRSKLIELILDNLSELNPREQQMVPSIRKIVECRFMSKPLQVQQFLGDGGAGLSCSLETRKEDCEEHAMLLFFLLQSYVRDRAAKMKQPNTQDTSPNHNSQNSPSFRSSAHTTKRSYAESWLTLDDKECLLQMGDHVDVLARRLKEHCSSLTFKTRLYLAQMESFRELT